MFINGPESHSRSLLKAISWRVTGSIDTFVLSWIITGNLVFAGSIASVEVVTKLVLYYFHERIWGLIPYGRRQFVAPDARREAPNTKLGSGLSPH